MIWKNKELKTIGEIFDTALNLAKTDNYEAGVFYNAYIDYVCNENGCSREEAEKIVKGNLGYFAGYYDKQTCDLIYKVYCTEHPIFGKKPFSISPEDAFKAGLEAGYKYK